MVHFTKIMRDGYLVMLHKIKKNRLPEIHSFSYVFLNFWERYQVTLSYNIIFFLIK